MSFRRLFTADGVHNYFWKASPIRPAGGDRATQQEAIDMASHGIRDKVAIVGMGCTPFGEHWDKIDRRSPRRLRHRGVHDVRHQEGRRRRVLARHDGLGHQRAHAEPSAEDRLQAGHPRREHVRHRQRGVPQRVRTPSPSGAYDVAMAIGVEKLKDSGFSGLIGSAPPNDGTLPTMTAPAIVLAARSCVRARSTASTRTR